MIRLRQNVPVGKNSRIVVTFCEKVSKSFEECLRFGTNGRYTI